MSEAKWSPEPWHRWPYSEREWDIGVGAEQDPASPNIAAGLSEPNSRRVVAAVNACAGIPTEALESGALATALERVAEARRIGRYVDDPAWDAVDAALRALGVLKP